MASILVATWGGFLQVAPEEPFLCWLHFPAGAPNLFEEGAIRIVRGGALGFFVTGLDSAEIHDRLDDVLDSIQRPEIPTVWSDEINSNLAREFLTLPIVDQSPSLHVICVFSPRRVDELAAMASILSALERAAAQ